MNKYLVLFICTVASALLSSCESTTTPGTPNAKFTDSTLFVLSEGDGGKINAQLDGYSLRKDSLIPNIINPLGDIGNDIKIIGKRMYLVLENSSKILSVNPDSVADRFAITFPGGETPYNMALLSTGDLWVSELTAKDIADVNLTSNTISAQIPIDTSLAFISVYNGKAYLLTNANKLEVVDVATKNVLSNKYIGDFPAEIAIDTIHNSLIVLTYGSYHVSPGKILWVNPNTYAVTDSLTIASTDFINQVIIAGTKAFLTYGDRLSSLDLTAHKISAFKTTAYYKGIYDPSTNQLIVGRGDYSSPGNVDILDGTTGAVKKTFASGILPGHFVIYRK